MNTSRIPINDVTWIIISHDLASYYRSERLEFAVFHRFVQLKIGSLRNRSIGDIKYLRKRTLAFSRFFVEPHKQGITRI